VKEDLLTVREVAPRLGIARGTILKWAREKKIPSVKLPSGAVRFVPSDVDAWVEAHQRPGTGREQF